jgi:hypothetical protein
MKGRVFQFAVLYHPRPSFDADLQPLDRPSEIIVSVTTIAATSENEARTLASRAIPEKYVSELDRTEVVVVPFGVPPAR